MSAIEQIMVSHLRQKPTQMATKEYFDETVPFFILKCWGYNTNSNCNEDDYLGSAPAGTKNREQQKQEFQKMSALVIKQQQEQEYE